MWKSSPEYCTNCSRQITGRYFVTSKGDKFHEDCFRCKDCNKSLGSDKFYFQKGRYYCRRDYDKNFGVQCDKCQGYMDGRYWVVDGKNYHLTCFRCSKCTGVISGRYWKDSDSYTCNNCEIKGTGLESLLTGIELCGFGLDDENSTKRNGQATESTANQETNKTNVDGLKENRPNSLDLENTSKELTINKEKKTNYVVGTLQSIFVKTCELLF